MGTLPGYQPTFVSFFFVQYEVPSSAALKLITPKESCNCVSKTSSNALVRLTSTVDGATPLLMLVQYGKWEI
jgi:hypothetical protein